MSDPFGGQWVLLALRHSSPGDVASVTPGVGAGLSRFVIIVGEKQEVMRHYDSCNQDGSQIILAEVRNPNREIVYRFDRVGSVLNERWDYMQLVSAAGRAATNL